MIIEGKEITDMKFANPAPFGLIGFGIALVMLSIHYTGLIPLDSAVFATIFAMGFLVQIIAGLFEFIKGNTFRATCFAIFSMFFLSLVLMRSRLFGTSAMIIDYKSLGFFFLLWSIIPILFLAKIKAGKHTMLLIGFILFAIFNILMCIGEFALSDVVIMIAGIVGILCGVLILIDYIMHLCKHNEHHRHDVI